MADVWIVDDDEFYQNFLSIYLNTCGYTTRCFQNGEDCLAHLNERPWAILLDHNLNSRLNGLDILKIIKESHPDIPVITISGSERAEIAASALENGSADYIQKDSASLIRLKLRFDRLKQVYELRSRKQKNRKRLYIILTVVVFVSLLITTLALTYF